MSSRKCSLTLHQNQKEKTMSKKAEALQTKAEDIKSEAIDTISQAMEKNGVKNHDFEKPIPYKQKDIVGIKYDPDFADPQIFIKTYEAGIDHREEIDELELDEILFILYNFEDEFEVD